MVNAPYRVTLVWLVNVSVCCNTFREFCVFIFYICRVSGIVDSNIFFDCVQMEYSMFLWIDVVVVVVVRQRYDFLFLFFFCLALFQWHSPALLGCCHNNIHYEYRFAVCVYMTYTHVAIISMYLYTSSADSSLTLSTLFVAVLEALFSSDQKEALR